MTQTTMDLTAFAADLDQDFTDVRLEHRGGSLLIPAAPADMAYFATEHFPNDCDDDSAYEFFRSNGGLAPFITFVWDEDDSPTWDTEIDFIRAGDRVYLTMPPDAAVGQAWEGFAAVDHPDAPEILDALFFDLMWDNGESYGVELFSSLPTEIHSPLLSKATVQAGFHLYLEWDDERNPGAWVAAAELLPSKMRQHPELAAAADALVAADTNENRDRFIEAYIDAALRL